MDVDPESRKQLRADLKTCGADLTFFEDADLDILWRNRYRSVRALHDATREGLTAAGLMPGLIDHILKLQDRAATAAGQGVGSAAGAGSLAAAAGRPDTSHEYIRRVLFKSQFLADVGPLNAAVGGPLLDQPLGAKLPVDASQEQALNSSSELQQYVVAQPDDELAANAHRLRIITTAALISIFDPQPGASESTIAMTIGLLVDAPLLLAAKSLGLNFQLKRNTADQSGATASKLRPDLLFWIGGVLLFKGEEKANRSELQVAVDELKKKMATSWNPVLLPGVSMPCMFAYAAAANVVQFFTITSCGGGVVEAAPVSLCLDISEPLGRIKVVHYTLKVLQALAAYAPQAPQISFALGSTVKVLGPGGNVLSSVEMYRDFVRKLVDLSQQRGSVLDFTARKDMYSTIGRMHCPNLVRLYGGMDDGIRLEAAGTRLLLHLAPVGLPMNGPPPDEAGLKQAVRDVLTGVAALHAAGFVHRDIRWPNVIRLPAASQSSVACSLGTYVLIDLEHAARADCADDYRQPELRLRSWGDHDILDPTTGRYTRESDLRLLAAALMAHLPSFALSDSGQDLWERLATRQVTSAEAALQHAWLAAT